MEDTSFEKYVEAMKHCLGKNGCRECPVYDDATNSSLWCVDGIRYIPCAEGVSAFTLKLLKDQFNKL